MSLHELKAKVEAIESELPQHPFVRLQSCERQARPLQLALTERLRKSAKKARIWKSSAMLTALKNAEYGLEPGRARSRGGSDGIFLLDRSFRPSNEMMRKIFDRYLDRAGSGVEDVAAALGANVSELQAVRIVSHHMRLLGVLFHGGAEDWVVIVDFDDTKE